VALFIERAVSVMGEHGSIVPEEEMGYNSLDQRRDAATTNGILMLGEDDELCKGILNLSGNFGFHWVRRLRGEEEKATRVGLGKFRQPWPSRTATCTDTVDKFANTLARKWSSLFRGRLSSGMLRSIFVPCTNASTSRGNARTFTSVPVGYGTGGAQLPERDFVE